MNQTCIGIMSQFGANRRTANARRRSVGMTTASLTTFSPEDLEGIGGTRMVEHTEKPDTDDGPSDRRQCPEDGTGVFL
jgi:hypothetical protein